jgi:integrase/recombinase XerD
VVDVKDPPHFVAVIFSRAPEWFQRWTEVTSMLDFYFKYPGVLRRMRRGPLASDIDDMADEFARLGYTHATARRYLSLLATFSRYAERVGHLRPETVDVALVERFLQKVRMSPCTRTVARSALGHAVRWLGRRLPATVIPTNPDNADDLLLAAFESYLREVRGLQPRSCEGVVLVARRLLHWYRASQPGKAVSDLGGQDILGFVADLGATCVTHATRSAAVSHVRGLLRYLHGRGVIRDDLARLVPRVPSWSLAKVPRYLAWRDVRVVIGSIDDTTAVGKRDRALLLILATTGLRSQEVRLLELGDIRWRTGELQIRRTKCRRERVVPLLEEAGRALATYILSGRPPCAQPTVFVCHVPPVRPIPLASTIAAIVRRRLANCGLQVPLRAGAHLFRHSVATRLVQQERPIKEVADLLGHHSIDTTAIYVKVAISQLERISLPFPMVPHE